MTILLICSAARSSHSHTHIGRNQDQQWNTADDNKLWFFSMPGTPGWPEWGDPLELVYQESGVLAGKYVVESLDCWHSGHPPHGNWQLGGSDPDTQPDWQVGIERVGFTDGFGMYTEDTFTPVLTSDGDTYTFDHLWMDEKHNENGELGAWGFHEHLLFVADAEGPGQTFSASFVAFDEGTTGFTDSDVYTMDFVTIPEPTTFSLLAVFSAGILFKRRPKRTFSDRK
jgi:hypothetical protein